MTMIACAFLKSRRLKQAKRKKEGKDRIHSRPFQQSERPSSPHSNGHRQRGVRIADAESVLKIC